VLLGLSILLRMRREGMGIGIQIGVEMEINLKTTGNGNFMTIVAVPSHDFLRPPATFWFRAPSLRSKFIVYFLLVVIFYR